MKFVTKSMTKSIGGFRILLSLYQTSTSVLPIFKLLISLSQYIPNTLSILSAKYRAAIGQYICSTIF